LLPSFIPRSEPFHHCTCSLSVTEADLPWWTGPPSSPKPTHSLGYFILSSCHHGRIQGSHLLWLGFFFPCVDLKTKGRLTGSLATTLVNSVDPSSVTKMFQFTVFSTASVLPVRSLSNLKGFCTRSLPNYADLSHGSTP